MPVSHQFAEAPTADCVSFVAPAPTEALGAQRDVAAPPGPSPEQLALRLFDRARALADRPELRIAPARIGLTGLTSYFWLAQQPRSISGTAIAGDVSVSAEAHPYRYVWDFGNGATQLTSHPGRRWTARRAGNVEHLYETKGTYDVAVEVIWEARWRVGAGSWRPLGYFSTTDSHRYPVREVIAFLVRSR